MRGARPRSASTRTPLPKQLYKFQFVSLLRETDLHIVFYIIAEIRPGFNAWGADFREFGPIPSPVKKYNRRLRRFFRFQPFLD